MEIRIFLTDYPHSCVTLYMYPLLLMSSVAVILDQHIKKSLQTLNGLGGLHYFCLGVTEQPTNDMYPQYWTPSIGGIL